MGKKGKKADLEQLLNSLIEKGWKPFGRNSNKAYYRPEWPDEFYFWENGYWYIYNRRQIVSRESWLWQFCIKNWLVEVDNHIPTLWEKRYKAPWVESIYKNDIHFEKECEYRLIESSLKEESELEDFLLNSIKLD